VLALDDPRAGRLEDGDRVVLVSAAALNRGGDRLAVIA
jgi:hypothetical protein